MQDGRPRVVEGSSLTAWLGRRDLSIWFVVIGGLLRLLEFAANRPLWLDEQSLMGNIIQGPTFGLVGMLHQSQVAPPLFLVAERVMARVFGDSEYSLRFLPLIAGLFSLYLFRSLSLRVASRRAATIALALFALSDEMVYFAVELKPYGSDIAIGLALGLASVDSLARPTLGSLSRLGVLGILSVWCSFPASFVLGGSGCALMIDAWRIRDLKRLAQIITWEIAWVLSFVGSVVAARTQIGPDDGLWRFWDFAFPPSLATDPFWFVRRVLFLFANPLDYYGPFDPRISALPAVICSILGLRWMFQDRGLELFLLAAPLTLAGVAAALHLYPFHGRLLLFSVPVFYLLLGCGVDLAWRRLGRPAGMILLVLLLSYPVALDAYHIAFGARVRSGLNPHGDRRAGRVAPDIFRLNFRGFDSFDQPVVETEY